MKIMFVSYWLPYQSLVAHLCWCKIHYLILPNSVFCKDMTTFRFVKLSKQLTIGDH